MVERKRIVTCVLGEVPKDLQGEVFRPSATASAPAYTASALPRQIVIGWETAEVAEVVGRPVAVELRGFPPDILLIQATVEVDDLFTRSVFDMEDRMLALVRARLAAYGGSAELSEEYSVFIVSGYAGDPEQFLEHAPLIASLLKSERQPLDPEEIAHTLATQIKYGENDLALVDWDGAFLFDPAGDTAEEIDLLILANLQLLRARLLDRELDARLRDLARLVESAPLSRLSRGGKAMAHDLMEVTRIRMQSIADQQQLERDVQLIGDWYSARFFGLAASKFKLEAWRRAIQGKLEALEDVYTIVLDRFSLSAKHRAEWVQIIVFFILQAGWILVLILELIQFSRH
jgi:hypothetical protein